MKKTFIVAAAIAFVAAAGFVTLSRSQTSSDAAQPQSYSPDPARVERGEYLVKIMGCNDCHTPWKMGPHGPEPDMTRFLSGHPEQIGPLPNLKAAEPYIALSFGTNTAYSGPWV